MTQTYSFPFLIAEAIQILNHWVFENLGEKIILGVPSNNESLDEGFEHATKINRIALESMKRDPISTKPTSEHPHHGESGPETEPSQEEDPEGENKAGEDTELAKSSSEIPAVDTDELAELPDLSTSEGVDKLAGWLALLQENAEQLAEQRRDSAGALPTDIEASVVNVRMLVRELIGGEIGNVRRAANSEQAKANVREKMEQIVRMYEDLQALALKDNTEQAKNSTPTPAASSGGDNGEVPPTDAVAKEEEPAESGNPDAIPKPAETFEGNNKQTAEGGITLEEIKEHQDGLSAKRLAFQDKLIDLNISPPRPYMDQYNRAADRLQGHLGSLSEALESGKVLEIRTREQQVVNALVGLDDLSEALDELQHQNETAQFEQFNNALVQFQGVPWMGPTMAVPAAFMATQSPNALAQIAEQLNSMQKQIDALQGGGANPAEAKSITNEDSPAVDDKAEEEDDDTTSNEAEPTDTEGESEYEIRQEHIQKIKACETMDALFAAMDAVPNDELGMIPDGSKWSIEKLKNGLKGAERKGILQMQKEIITGEFQEFDLGTHIPISLRYGTALREGMVNVMNKIREQRANDPGFDARFNAEFNSALEEKERMEASTLAVATANKDVKMFARLIERAEKNDKEVDHKAVAMMWRKAGLNPDQFDKHFVNRGRILSEYYAQIEASMEPDDRQKSLEKRMTKGLWEALGMTQDYDSVSTNELRAEMIVTQQLAEERRQRISAFEAVADDDDAKMKELWVEAKLPEADFPGVATAKAEFKRRMEGAPEPSSTNEGDTTASGADSEAPAERDRAAREQSVIEGADVNFQYVNRARDIATMMRAFDQERRAQLQKKIDEAPDNMKTFHESLLALHVELHEKKTAGMMDRVAQWHELNTEMNTISTTLEGLNNDFQRTSGVAEQDLIRNQIDDLEARYAIVSEKRLQLEGRLGEIVHASTLDKSNFDNAVETIDSIDASEGNVELSSEQRALYTKAQRALERIKAAQAAGYRTGLFDRGEGIAARERTRIRTGRRGRRAIARIFSRRTPQPAQAGTPAETVPTY